MKKSLLFVSSFCLIFFSYLVTGCSNKTDDSVIGILENVSDLEFQLYDVCNPETIYTLESKKSIRFNSYENTQIKMKKTENGYSVDAGRMYLSDCQLCVPKYVVYRDSDYYFKAKNTLDVPIIFKLNQEFITLEPGDEYKYISYFNDYHFYYSYESEAVYELVDKNELVVEKLDEKSEEKLIF